MPLMRFEITQRMIEEGARFSCSACPAALAIMAKLSDVRVAVYPVTGVFFYDDAMFASMGSAPSPPALTAWIAGFDDGVREALPFAFELDVPAQVVERAACR